MFCLLRDSVSAGFSAAAALTGCLTEFRRLHSCICQSGNFLQRVCLVFKSLPCWQTLRPRRRQVNVKTTAAQGPEQKSVRFYLVPKKMKADKKRGNTVNETILCCGENQGCLRSDDQKHISVSQSFQNSYCLLTRNDLLISQLTVNWWLMNQFVIKTNVRVCLTLFTI